MKYYQKTFLGECLGIGLYSRGVNDPHVYLDILIEDDDNWFEYSRGFSASWLPELHRLTQEAILWLENNCDKDTTTDIICYIFRY